MVTQAHGGQLIEGMEDENVGQDSITQVWYAAIRVISLLTIASFCSGGRGSSVLDENT